MSGWVVLRRVVAVIMIGSGLLGAGRVAWVGYGPRATDDDRQVASQIEYLEGAIDRGGAARMQTVFPEGEFFTHVLTGLAEASLPDGADRARLLAQARQHLRVADAPATVAIFGSGLAPEHGAFAAGWSLSLAVAIARASGDPADLVRVRAGAEAVSSALAGSASPFLPSYPDQYWPCDTVVAVSALAEAAQLVPQVPQWREQVTTWRVRALTHVEPVTGLLPHDVTAAGTTITGPRGSSNAIIQAFWPAIVAASGPATADDQWARFTAAFVTREAGLVGLREYPRGTDGVGDVDSGPLVLGVSASASAVGLAAARAAGDDRLAASLSREADLLGLPLHLPGGTRYAFGSVPVGDAFLVWARTRTSGPDSAPGQLVPGESPRPWWWAGVVPGVLVAVLGVALWRGPRRRVS